MNFVKTDTWQDNAILSWGTMSSKNGNTPEAFLASLLADYQKPEDLNEENSFIKQQNKLLL